MVLHLLGKKSWNVYNHDNIEKVKRDEATARAEEEAEEQRMQELDAERRIQILRGEIPSEPVIEDTPKEKRHRRDEDGRSGRERKRRKKYGENDTEFEMRIANENTRDSNRGRDVVLRKDNDAPITDHSGHISLFPTPSSKKPFTTEKNAEVEKEEARKKREYEDQYTMRFSNAAGFKQSLDRPWYSKTSSEKLGPVETMPGKDVWGNEDTRRNDRETKRVTQNDPLAMMKQGAAQVRQVEKERKHLREERDKEMKELKEAESRKRRHKRRHRDEDDLEGFSLDYDSTRSSSSRPRRYDDRGTSRRHKHSSRREHEKPDQDVTSRRAYY